MNMVGICTNVLACRLVAGRGNVCWAVGVFALCLAPYSLCAEVFVSPAGKDTNPGTADQPLKSIHVAVQKIGKAPAEPDEKRMITLEDGVHYMGKTLVLDGHDSGLVIRAKNPRKAVVSGAVPFSAEWSDYRDGIKKASVPRELEMDVLFVNGKPMHMARYPNYDPRAAIFHGTASDADGEARAAGWADPAGGYMHALHDRMWGGMHFRFLGKEGGKLKMEGGWQNNRPSGPHRQYRFVENIVEELDAPGEWYLDRKSGTLYLYPEQGTDLPKARLEAAGLEELVVLRQEGGKAVSRVTLKDLVFTGTCRTFMKNREPLLRSDWTIYRSGAVLMQGAKDCTVTGCDFVDLGGTAVFVDGKNSGIRIVSCDIHDVGGNGVAFVGKRSAYRGPRDYQEAKSLSMATMDKTPGPLTDEYPVNCLVDDCLIYRTGTIEKQTAGVEISLSKNISVRSCSIYDVPRAGINIGEGAWGGHVVEYCDVFDAVQETNDHGAFNSWGRDRFWKRDMTALSQDKAIVLLDVVSPIVLRNNRWRCDHGWDVDLDDGSSNYEIYNNVMLASGLKLREGFFRKVYNNILVNNSLHPHVWFRQSGDEVLNNIVFEDGYRKAGAMNFSPWGKRMDRNFVHVPGMKKTEPATGLAAASGNDAGSLKGDALFVNPARGDFSVKRNSPVLKLGFKNMAMNRFGVRSSRLKQMARTPEIPAISGGGADQASPAVHLREAGAMLRLAQGNGDLSVQGLKPEDLGRVVIVVSVEKGGLFDSLGMMADDVILSVNGTPLDGMGTLRGKLSSGGKFDFTIRRNQANKKVSGGR